MMVAKLLVAWAGLLVAFPAVAQDPSAELRREVRRGNYHESQALLSNPEVDPDARDARGYTALMFAAERDAPELVTLLIKADADLDIQNNDGETALIIAVRRGRVDASRLLLMAGADVTIRDSRGRTALDWARDRDRTYLAQIISIASRPAVANVILSEKPVTTGTEHLEPPRVVAETPPLYTENAFDRGIEGRVVLRVIIRKDGTVGAIRVHQSLDGELDQAAIDAVASWTFEPATVDGDPINVLADIEVDFQIERI
jgi:TonB family protein